MASMYCPHCGGDIDDDIDYELDGELGVGGAGMYELYLSRKTTLFQMKCGAIVQDGEWYTKSEAKEAFA